MTTTLFLSTSSLNAALTVKDVHFFAVNFNQQHYHDELYQKLNIALPKTISRAVTKRKAEYLSGRYAAIQALKELGVHTQEILIGDHRSPVFHQGIVASISHTNSTALCAAAFAKNIVHLGVDLEHILTPALTKEIEGSIISRIEKESIRCLSMPYEHAFSLIFSAKESLFKALYPNVKAYFDFSAAHIVQVDENNNQIKLELTETLTPTLRKGMQFDGFFHFNNTSVLTCIYEKQK